MEFRFSRHSIEQMVSRGIAQAMAEEVLANPQQVVPETETLQAYQSRITISGKEYLLRVIVNVDLTPTLVVTVYKTSKISKYWRT